MLVVGLGGCERTAAAQVEFMSRQMQRPAQRHRICERTKVARAIVRAKRVKVNRGIGSFRFTLTMRSVCRRGS